LLYSFFTGYISFNKDKFYLQKNNTYDTIKKKGGTMELQNYIGKVLQVKIIEKEDKCYIAKTVKENITVYIKDEEDYEKQELLGKVEKCIILDVINNALIGFLLTNRKFINDIKKIEKGLKNKEEYQKIKDIYLMERLKLKGKVVGLYLVDEGDIGKYYLDTAEIGIYYKKMRSNNILFKENTIENELAKQIKDVVQSIDLTKKEISLREEQEKEKHLIEKALGLEESIEITRIVTLDLEQEIKENNERVKKELNKFNFLKKKEQSKIKDVNIKQEMDIDNKVTDMRTLGKMLKDEGMLPQIEGKEFEKIGIIESDERDNLLNTKGEKSKVNTTRYSFVAITKDGSVVPLEIEQDYAEGNNPREINYQVNQLGQVKKDDVLSRFKIGEGTLAIKNGKYGEIKVYHSPRKTIGGKDIEGNKSLDRELETDNIWEIKKEERDLAEEFGDGYRSVEESYQEAKLHEDESGRIIDEDKIKTKDIDGDISTRSHSHDKVDYNALAVKWGYYKEGKPNSDKAKRLFDEKRKEDPKKETKEIIEIITDELEEELGHNRDFR